MSLLVAFVCMRTGLAYPLPRLGKKAVLKDTLMRFDAMQEDSGPKETAVRADAGKLWGPSSRHAVSCVGRC